jgi:uncharacterized membrane protein
MRIFLLSLPLFLSLAACGDKEDTGPVEGDTDTDTDADTDLDVGYAADVQPILNNRCATCHSGGNPPNGVALSSYSEVMASGTVVAGDSASSELVTIGSHHGSGWYTDAELTTVTTWIDDGALDD